MIFNKNNSKKQQFDNELNYDLFFDHRANSSLVLWGIFGCICVFVTFIIAQSNIGQEQLTTNFSKNIIYASTNDTYAPSYSVELALLQNELNRTKQEMRTAIATRHELEQKIALLENKFDDFATGSVNNLQQTESKPIPQKLTKFSNSKASIAIPANSENVQITYRELPELVTENLTSQLATAPSSLPPQNLTTLNVPLSNEPNTTELLQKNAAYQPPLENPKQLENKTNNISQNTVPLPPEKPKLFTVKQNGYEISAEDKKKLAMDLEKVILKEKTSNNNDTFKELDTSILTGALEPNKNITTSQATRSLFAVKLSTEKSMTDVNTKWQTTLKNNADVLAGLEPYIHFEETPKKPIQMNLTVGPFRNASDATTVCGKLSAAGTNCSVTPFVGQRLLP